MLICTMFSAVSQILLKQSANEEHASALREYLNWRVIVAYLIFGSVLLLNTYAAFLWRFERKGIKRKADWESDYYPGGTGVYIAVKRSDDGKKAISAKLSLSFEIGGLRTTNERLLIMNKKKIDYRFKILYAVAILMVVAGHCDGGGISLDFAQWFPYEGIHLALFTFCSGYFF